jgi:hypothetical protein
LRWLSKNMTGISLPVNADIPTNIQVHFVDELDAHASQTGAHGIGELGTTGVAAAVANGAYDAVGIRIRDLPITPARVVVGLTDVNTQRHLWMRSSHQGHRPARANSVHPLPRSGRVREEITSRRFSPRCPSSRFLRQMAF